MPGSPFKRPARPRSPSPKASKAARPKVSAVRNSTRSSAGAKRAGSGTTISRPKAMVSSEKTSPRGMPSVPSVKQPR